MKLGALANNVCRICGSETMGADIGCSCQKLYDKATYIVLKQKQDENLEYNYSIKMKVTMDKFCSLYESDLSAHNGDINKMHRSNFNRGFFPSVYKFYKEKGYVSAKQLEIVEKRYFTYGLDNLWEDIDKARESFLRSFKEKYDSEIIDVAWNLFKQRKAEKKAAKC